jgi:hypothetical protein
MEEDLAKLLETSIELGEKLSEQLEIITKRIETIESKIDVEGGLLLGKREFDKRLQLHATRLHARIDSLAPTRLGRTVKKWVSKLDGRSSK